MVESVSVGAFIESECAIKEGRKVVNHDWVNRQACTLSHKIYVVAASFISKMYPVQADYKLHGHTLAKSAKYLGVTITDDSHIQHPEAGAKHPEAGDGTATDRARYMKNRHRNTSSGHHYLAQPTRQEEVCPALYVLQNRQNLGSHQ